MKHARLYALFVVAVLCSVSANAKTYYWHCGEDASPLVAENYRTGSSPTSAVATSLPGPGDVIFVFDDKTISFDDDSVALLSGLGSLTLRKNSWAIVNITTNALIHSKLTPGSTGSTTDYVVKRGPGTLEISTPLTDFDNNKNYDTRANFIVEEGDLVFPQTGVQSDMTYRHGFIAVSNGCTVVLDGGAKTDSGEFRVYVERGIWGEGSVTYTNSIAPCRLHTAGGNKKPFYGVLSGDKLKLEIDSSFVLANEANTLGHDGDGCMYVYGGTVGFLKFGGKSSTETSSFGRLNSYFYLNSNSSTPLSIQFLYLGTESYGAQTTGSREFRDYGGHGTSLTFDGGAYGNIEFYDINLKAYNNNMRNLILTGSNTEACVWSGYVVCNAKFTGRYYLLKRGTGTWRMSGRRADSRTGIAGVGVENGTLQFTGIADKGTTCSLGAAESDYLVGYPTNCSITAVGNLPKVDYAIRLGKATDLSQEGTLEYVGTAAATCATRPIAVTGRGRFKNSNTAASESAALNWTDVRSVVPPESPGQVPELSTLTLDGAKPGTITDITEEEGAAPLRIAKDGAATWTLAGTLAFSGGIDVRNGVLSTGELEKSLPFVRVDGGATLELATMTEATGLGIDAAEGVGTISNVAFQPSGTVSVENMTGNSAAFPCDLSGCTGVENIGGWTLRVNGAETSRYSVSASATRVCIYKNGLVISIR